MNRLWPVLLPELRQFAEAERDEALRAARNTALDFVELVAMAAGVVAVTALTRHMLHDPATSTRFGATLANFAVAVPLLTVVLGPFHVRRLRRGLRQRLRTRGQR